MRQIYNPASLLHPTFSGPYRIIEISDLGALLKDPRTGEICSVHFQNLRKLTTDEFLTLLPTNFDADILKHMKMYRYNTAGSPERSIISTDPIQDNIIQQDTENLPQHHIPNNTDIQDTKRILRSGKIIKINVNSLPQITDTQLINATFVNNYSCSYATKILPPIIKQKFRPNPTPYASIDQIWHNNCYIFSHHIPITDHRTIRSNCKDKYCSKFQSPIPGTLFIDLEFHSTTTKVKFTNIKVNFY